MVGTPPSPASAAPRRSLLRAYPALRALFLSRAVSHIGDGMTTTVLVLLVAARDGTSGVGVLLLANAIPRFAGPLAGVLADRVETRRLITICEVCAAAAVGIIAVALPPLPVLVVLVAVTASLATIRNPAGRSLVPALVEPADRAPANALVALARTLQLAVGPGLGGVIALAPGGIPTALAIDVATFLLSAAALTGLPRIAPVRDPRSSTGIVTDAVAGLRYVGADRHLMALSVGLFLLVMFAAIENVALVFLVDEELGATPAGYGFAASAFGTGMVTASLLCTRLVRGRSPEALLVVGVLATGAGTIATGVSPVLAMVMVSQLIAGVGNAVENIAYDTVIQTAVPRAYLGRVFGMVSTSAQLGAALAYACGATAVDILGARATFVLAGTGTLVSLLVLVPTLLRARHDAQTRASTSKRTDP
jgi:MFS family permease